jgi:predicted nucleic acid-binding protein
MPGNTLFLDSAYVIALAQANDEHHREAVRLAKKVEERKMRLVTTRAVLLEVGSALARVRARPDAIRLVAALQSSDSVEIVPLSEELAARGWDLFCQRTDKEWSWTDCISFFVMRKRGFTDALTSDQHSEQAGFKALLRH